MKLLCSFIYSFVLVCLASKETGTATPFISYFFPRTQLFNHTVTAVDGLVFACAGSVEGRASLLLQNKVQCFNAHLNEWDFVAPLLEPRAKAASVEHQGLLYVSGKRAAKQ